MSMCAVHGQEYEALEGLNSCGELPALDHGVAPERAVVTVLRTQDVDQPSFRDPVLMTPGSEADGPIDAESGPASLAEWTRVMRQKWSNWG